MWTNFKDHYSLMDITHGYHYMELVKVTRSHFSAEVKGHCRGCMTLHSTAHKHHINHVLEPTLSDLYIHDLYRQRAYDSFVHKYNLASLFWNQEKTTANSWYNTGSSQKCIRTFPNIIINIRSQKVRCTFAK